MIPQQLTANTNNWNPGDTFRSKLQTTFLRVSTTSDITLSGLLAQDADSRFVYMYNVGSFDLTLLHESSLSADINRIICPDAINYVLQPGSGIYLWYDGDVNERWRVFLTNTIPIVPIVYWPNGGDDYPVLQSLLDNGADVYLPGLRYNLSQELIIAVDGTKLHGRGQGTGAGINPAGTTALWRTAGATGAVLRVRSYDNTDPYTTVLNVLVEGMSILGNAHAEYGFEVNACKQSIFRDLYCQGSSVSQIIVRAGYDASKATDTPSSLTFQRVAYSAGTTDAGFTITKGHSSRVEMLSGGNIDGPGLLMNGPTDDWTFYDAMLGTTGTGFNFDIDQTYSTVFFHGWPMYGLGTTPVGGKGIVRKTTSNPTVVQFIAQSTIDRAGLARVQVSAGAICSWIDDLGRFHARKDNAQDSFIDDDFDGLGELPWVDSSVGGTTPEGNGFLNAPGIRDLITGAVANNKAVLSTSGTKIEFDPAQIFEVMWRFASTIDANTKVRVGLCAAGTQANDPPSDGIWIENISGEANYFAVCRNGGVQTRASGIGSAVSGAYNRFRMRRVSTGIGFMNMRSNTVTNDADLATITTNIPTVSLVAFAQIITAAAASKTCNLEYFSRWLLVDR